MRTKTRKRRLMIFFLLLTGWVLLGRTLFTFAQSDASAITDFRKDSLQLVPRFLTINGRKLHLVQTGSGQLPTLFFIHGSPGSWTAFKDYLKDKDLLRQYRMVSIDRPGFGLSDFGKALNLEQQVQLLNAVIDSLSNGAPFYLIGHSLAGATVLSMAVQHPEPVHGIVVLAGSVDPAAEKRELWRRLLFRNPLQYLLPGAFRPSNEELVYLKTDLLQMPQQIRQVRCPVFLVHGTADKFVPYRNALWAKERLVAAERVQLVTFEGASHFIPWTHYAEIKKLLLQLTKQP